MNNLIVDVDGTLLNWKDTFYQWAVSEGWVPEGAWKPEEYDFAPHLVIDPTHDSKIISAFNQSYHIGQLPPIYKARPALRAFRDAGFSIKVITAFSTKYESIRLREKNLIGEFGDIFDEIATVPVRHSKREWLAKQPKNSYYVEDVAKHVREALSVGFLPNHCFMIPQTWNLADRSDLATEGCMTQPWDQIVNIVLGVDI